MYEHLIEQSIRAIDIDTIPDVQGGYAVGRNDVTRIEACTKPGPYCDIPYVRVWKGDVCEAEFCQHNIVGVYFGGPEPTPVLPAWEAPVAYPADHTGEPSCICTECIPF